MSKFLEKKDISDPEVKEAICALEKVASRSSDAAWRVACTVLSEHLKEDWMNCRHVTQESNSASLMAFTHRRGTTLGDFPASDHAANWKVQPGHAAIFTSQPYSVGLETLRHIVGFCDQFALEVRISGDSFHAPGRTVLIEVTKKQGV